MKHPEDIVEVILHSREARMPGLKHHADPFGSRLRKIDGIDLCAGDHQIRRTQIRDLERALDHGISVCGNDAVGPCFRKRLREVILRGAFGGFPIAECGSYAV